MGWSSQAKNQPCNRRPQVDIEPEWLKAQPYSVAFFTDVAEQLQGMVQHVDLRGVDG